MKYSITLVTIKKLKEFWDLEVGAYHQYPQEDKLGLSTGHAGVVVSFQSFCLWFVNYASLHNISFKSSFSRGIYCVRVGLLFSKIFFIQNLYIVRANEGSTLPMFFFFGDKTE